MAQLRQTGESSPPACGWGKRGQAGQALGRSRGGGSQLLGCDPVQREQSSEIAVRQGTVQGALTDRMHLQPTQTGAALRHPLRENAAQLRSGSCHWVRTALAANLVSRVLAASSQFNQHRYDTNDQGLARVPVLLIQSGESVAYVQQRGRFRRRPSRCHVVTPLSSSKSFPAHSAMFNTIDNDVRLCRAPSCAVTARLIIDRRK